jgi:type II secretory pathway pseudopilin PulG
MRGMTLIEVTVAGALLAIGAAGILASWGTVTGVIEHQRRFSEATNLTRMQVERLLVLPADSAPLSPGTYNVGNVDAFGTPTGASPAAYVIQYEVRTKPAPGFVEITVTTSWTEKNGAKSTSFNVFRER